VKERTRLLGVDFGTVRIGLAISDPDRRIASPLATYEWKGSEAAARFFSKLVDEEQIGGIVLGMPVHLDGREGEKARQARKFGAQLTTMTMVPVVFWDERFTTVEAEHWLQAAGLTSKRRKARRDQVAAQILLQAYLDAGCPGEQELRPLDE
jgi:putative Holliday junction resolvase